MRQVTRSILLSVVAAMAVPAWVLVPSAGFTSAALARPSTVMWIEQDGVSRPFENGGRIVSGDITVEIFVAPYPPLREGTIDLYLTERATGRALGSKTLRIIFDMDMPHGSIRAEAMPAGGGHFLVPYRLVMPGQWRIDITVARGSNVAAFTLIFKID